MTEKSSKHPALQQPLHALRTPLLVLQTEVLQKNCDRMLQTCKRLGVKLRAQTKTHKTVEGALLQTGGTLKGLVCSTLAEVELYAAAGAEDVLLGHPLTSDRLGDVYRLAGTVKDLHLMVDSLLACELLASEGGRPPPGHCWSVFLKLDCGKQRAGVWHEDVALGTRLLNILENSPQIQLRGLYVHCGDTYAATTVEELTAIRDRNLERLQQFAAAVKARGVQRSLQLTMGSTPSCLLPCAAMADLDELHPGNYVFCDTQQARLGACSLEDIAVCVATRVVGHYPRRNQLLVDCGFTALTKQGSNATTGYGLIRGHPELRLVCMDQEHGFIESTTPGSSLDWDSLPVGHMLFILPYHSCATAAMYDYYAVVSGPVAATAELAAVWRPTRGW